MVFKEINLQNKKAVFLDIDDTLYSYQDAHKKAIQVCVEQAPEIENFEEIYRKHRNIITKRLKPTGACRSRLLAFMEMFEDLKVTNPYNKAIYFNNLYWGSLIDNIKMYDDVKIFIDDCISKKIKIIITTDMLAETQIQKLNKMDMLSKISYLVTSEQVGCEKSEKLFFEFALNRYNLKPEDVVCIGDDKVKDYEVPLSLGITSYLVDKKRY